MPVRFMNEIEQTSPNISLEWLAVADGQIDIANLGGARRLPDGFDEAEIPLF
jgi:hypothetical protein